MRCVQVFITVTYSKFKVICKCNAVFAIGYLFEWKGIKLGAELGLSVIAASKLKLTADFGYTQLVL